MLGRKPNPWGCYRAASCLGPPPMLEPFKNRIPYPQNKVVLMGLIIIRGPPSPRVFPPPSIFPMTSRYLGWVSLLAVATSLLPASGSNEAQKIGPQRDTPNTAEKGLGGYPY